MTWVIFTAMFLLAGAIILLPLYGAKRSEAATASEEPPGSKALVIYRQQLAELERDLSSGLLDEEEAEMARLEIHRRMLAASGETSGAAVAGLSRRFVTALAIMILLGATLFYVQRGKPGLVSFPIDRSAAADPAFQLPPEMGKIEDRLAQLEAKLAEEPDNLAGWTMLARSYRVMGRRSEAAAAYGRAARLAPDNAELRLIQAELLIEILDGLISPAARMVLAEMEEIDPGHPAPGFYLGLAEYQNNNARGALEIWRALEAKSPADAPWLAALREQIGRAQVDLGVEPGAGQEAVPVP